MIVSSVTRVFITTQFEGFHRWPSAPDCVKFLRDLHRHVFHVSVGVRVGHDDRHVEFFMLKTEVDHLISSELSPALKRTETLSCEQMAKLLGDRLTVMGYSVREIEVNEDNQNGAIVIWGEQKI